MSGHGEAIHITRTYLDNEIQHVAEATHARLHSTYLGHKDVHFFHHDVVALCVVAGDT